ncbi:MAG: SDR family NAD(P)-dependent oxidoreductase, partial [Rhodobacteraceae bacterium]|nr:SDR family NAD(P)-dependent oxidoreductase [Paracoccaceae bacterium]
MAAAGERGAAIVVGGSGGIGRGIVAVLAARGWDLAITWRTGADRAEAAAGAARAAGVRATTHAVDLAAAASVAAMVAAAAAAHGAPACVVYAAGPLVPQRHLSRITPEEMRDHLLQDTLGFFHLVHAALPHLRARGGSLVACVSAAQFRHAPADGLSVVPKAGVLALLLGVAKEEGRHGVRANGVAVGLIEAGQ